MVSDTYINRASESYRRGVIFGLTIAEVLLLLIFCILLLLKFTFDQKNKEIEQLDNNNENLTKQIDTFEAWISTIPVTNIKSGLVETVLSTLDEEQRENLLANASLAANNSPSELADMQARADEWEELTTLSRYSVSEEEHAVLNTLDEEQRENLLANASLAANNTPNELADMQARAEISNNKWPPIISLSEARNYSFEVGSATLAPQFKQALKGKIAEQILALLNEFDADIIEVIGHTDQQPMSSTRTTNLDKIPLSFLTSNLDLTLNARDNAGLGYSRALSVIKELKKVSSLQKYTILPYSAAQMITPDEELNTGINDYDRSLLRRIEIRVRRKQKDDL